VAAPPGVRGRRRRAATAAPSTGPAPSGPAATVARPLIPLSGCDGREAVSEIQMMGEAHFIDGVFFFSLADFLKDSIRRRARQTWARWKHVKKQRSRRRKRFSPPPRSIHSFIQSSSAPRILRLITSHPHLEHARKVQYTQKSKRKKPPSFFSSVPTPKHVHIIGRRPPQHEFVSSPQGNNYLLVNTHMR